jgi:hypothetical protein
MCGLSNEMSTCYCRCAFIDTYRKQKELLACRGREQRRPTQVTGSNLQFEVLQRLSCTYRAPHGCVNRAVDKHFDEF